MREKDKKVKVVIQNCNLCVLNGPLVVLNKLYKEYEVKHPNAWQIQMHSKRGGRAWDGMIHYISDTGKFRIGLLPSIYKRLIELGISVEIVDMRPEIGVKPIVPKVVGKLTPRPVQADVIRAIVNNKVGNTPFYIGVQNLAVNFGKTLIMASVHLAFKSKLKTLVLTQDSDWFKQAQTEFKDLIVDEPISFIQGGKVKGEWANFSIGMVQTLSRNIKTYQRELSKIDILLIDECDLIDNKTYKTVIEHLWNTRVRLGLSGTIYMSKLKKELVHNQNIRSFLGDELSIIKLDDMIKKGYSTPVVVKMVPNYCNLRGANGKFLRQEYQAEYNMGIVDNEVAYYQSYLRVKKNMELGRLPALVVCKFIPHCEKLYAYYKKRLDKSIRIEYVHHKTKERDKIMSDFRDGKIDILISTTIISRGKNFPLLRYIQNIACMDSNEKSIQILGRLARTSETKKKAYLDDMFFEGSYLSRHSKHRKNYYIRENLKVIDLCKLHKKDIYQDDLPF